MGGCRTPGPGSHTRVADLHDEIAARAPWARRRRGRALPANSQRRTAVDGGCVACMERRSCTLWRDEARGVMKISVEVPMEQGEVIAQALERAAQTGDSTIGIEFTAFPKSKRRSAIP